MTNKEYILYKIDNLIEDIKNKDITENRVLIELEGIGKEIEKNL